MFEELKKKVKVIVLCRKRFVASAVESKEELFIEELLNYLFFFEFSKGILIKYVV